MHMCGDIGDEGSIDASGGGARRGGSGQGDMKAKICI